MSYNQEFLLFWEEVKQSVQAGKFAKLTMAKTIGKPALRNVFVRPTYSKDDFKVLLKLRYRSRDTPDIEKELSIDEALPIIESHLKNPFFTVLLFTTEKDISFKINKKGFGSLSTGPATFSDVILATKDEEL